LIRRIGKGLIIVGVGHVFPDSLEHVDKTIAEERPDVVALELCPARYMALKTGRRESPKGDFIGWLMYLLQAKFSRQTGILPGEEMLTAIKCAEKTGACIELIDIPIDLTLRKLNRKMKIKEKIMLALHTIFGLLTRRGQELSRLTDEDVVRGLIEELRRFSPGIHDVLIKERDAHMASKLAALLSQGKRIVAVVGAAHVPGIERLLTVHSSRWSLRLEYETGV